MLPPVTDAGFKEMPITFGGFTVRYAPIVLVPAFRRTLVMAATGLVAMENVPVFAPPAIVQEEPATAALLLLICTVQPAAGAADCRVSVPVDLSPPITVDGLSAIDLNSGGLTVNVLLTVVPVAEMLTAVAMPTGMVLTVNVPDVAPPATLHDVTVAADLLLDSGIVTPPLGAGPLSVSVPVDRPPPTTEAGLSFMLIAAGGLILSMA